MSWNRLRAAVLWAAVCVCACTSPQTPRDAAVVPGPRVGAVDAGVIAVREVDPSKVKSWDEIKKLSDEQKHQAALDATLDRLALAVRARDGEEWTRALVRATQLRTALHGYETSVRFLREQPWPKEALHRATLQLYYAWAISEYVRAYQWEIRQREKVESKSEVDLKAWTLDQLHQEIQRAYLEVWGMREDLGEKPVAALSEYVHPNDYPRQIRGTLRDAVTYLWVGHLADTTGWRPEHHNELYRLDWTALVRAEEGWARKVDLADPAVHPLAKLAAVLGDLEAWHASRDDREAALEARLERLTRLHDAESDVDRRKALREDLEKVLAGFEDVPWWSTGMAQLGHFQRAAGMLVRAHQTAEAGRARYPDSVGGRRCLSLKAQLEAPDVSLQGMSHDGANARSLLVTHRNLDALWFRAYPKDLERRIAEADDYNLLPSGREVKALLQEDPAVQWKVDLPKTPDLQSHRTWVTPPLTRKGLYVIVASAREDFADHQNRVLATSFILTDLAMVTRAFDDGSTEVTVVDARTGQPEPAAQVVLYRFDYRRGHKVVETRRTNREGRAVFRPTAERRRWGHFFVAKRRADRVLDQRGVGFHFRAEPEDRSRTLVYTDRSIYRPNQTLHWKAVAFRGNAEDARYRVLPNARVTVHLVDPNGQEVAEATATTNGYGSASGEFQIPAGRLLGRWSLRVSPQGHVSFRVEEYKRPTFTAELKDARGALRLNKEATFEGEARYYFGLPVVTGSVRWTVTREPVFPWWWWHWGYQRPSGNQTQKVAAGTSALDAEGRFEIAFTPSAEEPKTKADRAVTWSYRVVAEVTDEGGETRTAEKRFRLGFVAVEAQVKPAADFFTSQGAPSFTVLRTDLNGAPRPGEGTWRVVSLRPPAKARMPADLPVETREDKAARPEGQPEVVTPGDRLRPRWDTRYQVTERLASWEDGPVRQEGTLTHGEKGDAAIEARPLPPGAYRLRYQTKDAFGETYETFRDFLVAEDRMPLPLPLALEVQSGSAKVGETVRVLVHSGFPGQPVIFELWRAGKRLRRELLAGGRNSLLELPVREADRGGFTVSVLTVRDHQLLHLTEHVFVPWDDKELKLELSTFRDKIRPGTKETFRVRVSGPDGEAVKAGAAELLAYMFDESLDYFGPHSPQSVASLYPSRVGEPPLHGSLSVAHGQWVVNDLVHLPTWPSLQPDRLRFYEGYGVGGPGRRRYQMSYRRGAAVPRAAPVGEVATGAELMVMEDAEAPEEKRKAEDKNVASFGQALGGEDEAEASRAEAPAADVPLRADFSETAFWQPHLVTGADGSVTVEFEVPDSVTGWHFWVHAVTRDLRGGSVTKTTRSVKELMVRPYLPRFLREGDTATIKVVVNNASEQPLTGTVAFDIVDPETKESLLGQFGLDPAKAKAPFTAQPGKGANVAFPIVAPKRPGQVAFKVTATSGNLSDGELRPLPVLPSRMHLAQSRFVTLRDEETRTLRFEDMAAQDDPTLVHDQLVVTVDAQLFYTVLQALPYLVNYPYECTEQTLNRFVSSGIVRSLYDQYPAVARMAKTLSTRDTRLEPWAATDPNRKMALEETPWLELSRGNDTPRGTPLLNVLDPRVARAERDAALARLREAQTSLGAFPWFPGGPPSPYMTLYILHGLARAAEHGVEVPKELTVRAWGYLARHFREEYAQRMLKEDCCWEFLTFLNYVAGAFPDASYTGDALSLEERRQILDHTFKHWKEHSPYLKGYLALTLKRMGRAGDATLVWESVMDSAKTTPDQGTFWAPEDRAWLWYNDTIETHAFALRTLMELAPKDARRHGLVQWLLINKKLSHWKSTRATAEVIYALVKYLEAEGALGQRETIHVEVGPREVDWVFEPDVYTGKNNQLVVPGPEVDPGTMSTVTVSREGKGFAFASATWRFSTDKLPEEDEGDFFRVSRRYFQREKSGRETVLRPLAEGQRLEVGDEVEVHLSLRNKHAAEYVHLRDPRPAGFEPENPVSRYRWDLGIAWYEETRDSGTNFFFEWLPVGEYTFKYRLRVSMAGRFRVGPATVQSMYAPEFNAYSAGHLVVVE